MYATSSVIIERALAQAQSKKEKLNGINIVQIISTGKQFGNIKMKD
jgi:hypothetical protein